MEYEDTNASNLQPINTDLADIPATSADVDDQAMTDFLSPEDLTQIWSGDADNSISEPSRLALYWHHCLHHTPLVSLHHLATRGVLPKAIIHVLNMTLCTACAFATAQRRSWRTESKSNNPIQQAYHDALGKGTSCDHIISHQPGLIPQTTGILTHEKFWGSVLFTNHYSDFIDNHLITGTTSIATLEAKQDYERVILSYGVTVKSYHAENFRFNDNNFSGDCIKAGQQLTHCGVGVHHRNAIAECKIKVVWYGSRTIILHAKRKWPAIMSAALWPYTMQAVVERHNRLALDKDGLNPLKKYSEITGKLVPTDFHTWGCPVYILDAANQGAIGTPKWEPRAHAGIYLGQSSCHTNTVVLVLNLQTGHISPQFHVVFDNEFSTLPYLTSHEAPLNWQQLLANTTEKFTEDQT